MLTRALRSRAGQPSGRQATIALVLLAAMAAIGAGTSACTSTAAHPRRAQVGLRAVTRQPSAVTSVLSGAPDMIAATAAEMLFMSAPVAVVADPADLADVSSAVAVAERAHAPLLFTRPKGGVGTALRAAVSALHTRVTLAVGVATRVLSAGLARVRVITNSAMLPTVIAPAPLGHTVGVLVHHGDSGPGLTAAVTTAQVAGAEVIAVHGSDPRADPSAIAAISAAKPLRVLAIGAGFAPTSELASRLAVAATGVQLPGGGQVLFPMRRLVALYGNPGTPVLGALGQQGLSASIARIKKIAARYRALSGVPVVPAFEIIATVALASPGPDGSYSNESSVASLRPWVRKAIAAGMYVILDLQAGRASLLAQAEKYQSLLRLPDVGLALDPEWKLGPHQRPLRQIGSVSAAQVNTIVSWLAALTARNHLPQKLLVLHQFKLSMLGNERRIDTRQDDLAIVIHMDGQGTPAEKQQTWDSVITAAPRGVFFGWKNFFVKDHPTLRPRQTMARTPQPVMISYQ